MFQFTTFHNDDSFGTLTDLLEVVEEHGLTVVDQFLDTKWDETVITIRGTRDQFEKFFLTTTEDPSQSVNIDEFMDELEEVA